MIGKEPWRATPYLLMGPALLFLVLFFFMPVSRVLVLSFTEPRLTFANYERLISVPLYLRVFANTLKNACIVTIICAVCGYPIAYAILRSRGLVAAIFLAAVAIPFWTGYLVRSFAWVVIFGNEGPIANLFRNLGFDPPRLLFTSFAALVGMAHILLPYMIFSLYSVMKKIDVRQLQAAESLGARPFTAFRRVFFPQSLPGIINGSVLVFTMCLGFYVTPALLGRADDIMIAQLISQQVTEVLNWGFAASLSVALMTVTLAILALYNRFFGLQKLWE